jgi:hypothetical protein
MRLTYGETRTGLMLWHAKAEWARHLEGCAPKRRKRTKRSDEFGGDVVPWRKAA